MTPIADMVEQMLSAGLPAEVIVLAVQTAEFYVQCHRDVTVTSHGDAPGAIRTRRWREKHKQNKEVAEANDAAPQTTTERHAVTSHVTPHCDLSLLNKEETTEEGSKERVVTRARGTRLSPDWQPNEADRQFARDHGVDVEKQRAEFVDYWIGVPGQRGTKLDWPATWRNRVRAVSKGPVTSPKLVDVSGFYADFASPQLAAWEAYERDGGKKYPRDKRGGWRFPTEWPPGYEKAA